MNSFGFLRCLVDMTDMWILGTFISMGIFNVIMSSYSKPKTPFKTIMQQIKISSLKKLKKNSTKWWNNENKHSLYLTYSPHKHSCSCDCYMIQVCVGGIKSVVMVLYVLIYTYIKLITQTVQYLQALLTILYVLTNVTDDFMNLSNTFTRHFDIQSIDYRYLRNVMYVTARTKKPNEWTDQPTEK